MKLITYALWGADKRTEANAFEFYCYLRGFYWNVRMNNLIYPDWYMHVELDQATYDEYGEMFEWLKTNNNLNFNVNPQADPRCKSMLWRLKPAFTQHITHILPRDADSITTYKEACAVQHWLESEYGFHAINDNPAHAGLMGGLMGFDTAKLKAATGCHTWEQLMDKAGATDFSQHGSDQNFMNGYLLPIIRLQTMCHNFAGAGVPGCGQMIYNNPPNATLPKVPAARWESNLTCRHIGSAGVVEMETIRFLKRFDEYDWKYVAMEKMFPKLFHWHLKKEDTIVTQQEEK